MHNHRKGFHSEGERHHQGHGHHSHEGEGFGRGGRARRGEARFVLLDALRDGPRHGYEIIKALEERSSGQYAPSPGTVYPTLQYLEDLELINAVQEAERRVYHLTEKGQIELDARAKEIKAFWSRFQKPDTSSAGQAEVGFLWDELDYLMRTVRSVVRDISGRDDRETIRRIRLAVEQCRNEVRRIITEPESSVMNQSQEEKE
jgi:DNA-binding PadR family transcriptional regulator